MIDLQSDTTITPALIEQIVDANAPRRDRFNAEYDPIRGVGATGKREPLQMADDASPIYVPASLAASPLAEQIREAGTFERCKSAYNLTDDEYASLYRIFLQQRAYHDPEFWFAAAVTIQVKRADDPDPEADKSDWGAAFDSNSVFQPFVLRRPQREFLAALMEDFRAGRPVRWNLVKARQWGGSTLVQLLMMWVQQVRRKGWHIAIVADVQGQALHIRNMYDTARRFYPERAFGPVTFKPYQGLSSVKRIPEREAILGVASTKNPDAVRSYTYHMLHLSEVGLWKSTPKQNAEDLAQALEGGLVSGSETICIRESTAKGVGNYFHGEYEAAKKGNSAYSNHFVGWHEISEYQMDVREAEIGDFVRSWGDHERELWMQGATIEGIRWYRWKKSTMPDRSAEWRMKAEYPTTAEEAFQSTGRRVFRPGYVRNARRTCKPAAERGRMVADARSGDHALDNLTFEADDHGDIYVWRRPHDDFAGLLDLTKHRVRGRYCAFMDIGARHAGGDWHVVTILDRAPMLPLFQSGPEVVAQYRGHMDQDLAAWYAVQLCAWYDNALLAVEKNSLRSKRDSSEPDSTHHMTVLDEIRDVYERHLYYTVERDQVADEKRKKFGFHTNQSTKPMIVDALNAALRDSRYVERDKMAAAEMDYYEVKDDGRLGAKDGKHDDMVVSRAGSVWIALNYMSPPKLIERKAQRKKRKSGAGMATFS